MKVVEVMAHLTEAERDVLKGIGIDHSDDLEAVLDKYKPGNGLTQEQDLAIFTLRGAWIQHFSRRFAPKLDFRRNCEILGLTRLGYTRESVAKIYGVGIRTVSLIRSDLSTRYRRVREEERMMGRDNFIKHYVTPSVIAAATEATKAPDSKKPNNRSANSKVGMHIVQGPACTYKHRVEIRWLEPHKYQVDEEGWYYRDLDSDYPNDWFHTGVESMRTSFACYEGMVQDITDKLS
jgi:hypothetical protein